MARRGNALHTLLLVTSLLGLAPLAAEAAKVKPTTPPVAVGDVLVAIGEGRIAHYSATGEVLAVRNTGTQSREVAGLCFDPEGTLYTTNWDERTLSAFTPEGALVRKHWAGPFAAKPIDCTVSPTGALYVGFVDGPGAALVKLDPDGAVLATYDPVPELRGVAALALGPDACTLFYASQGHLIKRFDVCTNTQLPDFAALPTDPVNEPIYGLRVRPNGEVLAAEAYTIFRLDPTGDLLQTYTAASLGETSFFFALSLDPDDTTFWTAGYFTGQVYQVDLETGAVRVTFPVPPATTVPGLAVYGGASALEPQAPSADVATGGGVFGEGRKAVAYTFALPCAPGSPASLSVTWGRKRFALTDLTSALCSEAPGAAPSDEGYNTHQGTGTGTIDGKPGATAWWTFTGVDAGYATAYAELVIIDSSGRTVVKVAGVPADPD